MQGEHGFNWISLIPGLAHAPNHVVMSLLVAGALILMTAVASAQLARLRKTAQEGLVPESRLSFRNFFEIVAEKLFALTESVIGHHDAPRYFPIVGTLFLFIFSSNLLGLIPGLLPPTENLNTTLALGLFVFLYYNYIGFKAHGAAYLKSFLGPVLWLAPLLLIIEVVSHVFRPISLAFRLRGNIMGDHMVLSIFSEKAPYIVPVIFYGLGLFVSFVQAFVFCLMTMVYISLSTAHDH